MATEAGAIPISTSTALFQLSHKWCQTNRLPFGAETNFPSFVEQQAINKGMAQNYWLVKSEPAAYSWQTFVRDGKTAWTGVRNFQARNNLRAMKQGDFTFFYHSVSEKQIVGLAKVAQEAYPDATAKEGDWSCVDLVPVKALARPVTLEQIKADPALQELPLIRQSRLSVTPLTEWQFKRLLALAHSA